MIRFGSPPVLAAILLGGSSALAQTERPQPWSVRFAESVMKRNPEVTPRWDYIAGVVLLAIDRVATTRKSDHIHAYVKRNMDRFVQLDGTITGYKLDDFNLDQIAQGRLLFPLYERTKDNRYRIAASHLREQLQRQPRTPEGGF